MLMELVIIAILVVVIIGLVFGILRTRKQAAPSDALLLIQQELQHMRENVDTKLSESAKTMQTQFGQSATIIRDVTERLTRLDETNRQVVGFTDQLKSLQDILQNPKQRGILGEYYLETVLKNVLPPGSFQMQYSFKDGTIVDAVVFVDKRIIPIDSKFSLENYNRILETKDPAERKRYESAFIADLKTRIDETAKYVQPAENTMDFAFMFIPSEAVYYDLLINQVGAITGETNNLIYYAGKKKVIVISPTSFLAYLQTVLQGLRNQKISEQAREVVKEVERLGKHLTAYSEYMRRLGGHLGTTVSSYNKASHEFKKVDKDVVKIAGGEQTEAIEEVEKPLLEE